MGIQKPKKVNMCFKSKNEEITFYEANLSIIGSNQLKLEFEEANQKKRSYKIFNKTQFINAAKKGIIRQTMKKNWWDILKVPNPKKIDISTTSTPTDKKTEKSPLL